jgi:hypothetical protein
MLEKQDSEAITNSYRLTNDMKYLVESVVKHTTKGRINIWYRLNRNRLEFYISSNEKGTTRDYKDLVSGLSFSTALSDDDNLTGKSETTLLFGIRNEQKKELKTLISDQLRGYEIRLIIMDFTTKSILPGT